MTSKLDKSLVVVPTNVSWNVSSALGLIFHIMVCRFPELNSFLGLTVCSGKVVCCYGCVAGVHDPGNPATVALIITIGIALSSVVSLMAQSVCIW